MQKIITGLKSLDKDTYKIIKYGLIFSSLVCLVSVVILLSYIFLGINLFYHIGICLMESSFIFGVEFIVCGIVVDFIRKKQI